jgi:hypothetical integral membrane protein (TIGR02206 family)
MGVMSVPLAPDMFCIPLAFRARWLALTLVVALTALLSFAIRTSAGQRHGLLVRRAICWGLAALLLLAAALAEVHRVYFGIWTLGESLPLHLCDIGLFVVAATLAGAGARRTPSRVWQRCFECAFVWGLGGTLQAVLTPDVDDGALNALCLRYFVAHGGILVGVFVLTFGLRLRMERGAAGRVWLVTLLVALVVGPLDWLLGANYMYLLGPPEHPSILDALGRWPWPYLPGLVLLATGLILLCYTPFWLLAAVRSRKRAISA